MVRQNLSVDEFNVEVEKMVCKKKLDNAFNIREDDLSSAQPDTGLPAPNGRTSHSCRPLEGSQVSGLECSSKVSDFNVKWEEASGKMPFNEMNKVLDLANLQCTRYKHNKEVFLPQLESPELESAHQTRRLELNRVFSRVVSKQTNISKFSFR